MNVKNIRNFTVMKCKPITLHHLVFLLNCAFLRFLQKLLLIGAPTFNRAIKREQVCNDANKCETSRHRMPTKLLKKAIDHGTTLDHKHLSLVLTFRHSDVPMFSLIAAQAVITFRLHFRQQSFKAGRLSSSVTEFR